MDAAAAGSSLLGPSLENDSVSQRQFYDGGDGKLRTQKRKQ